MSCSKKDQETPRKLRFVAKCTGKSCSNNQEVRAPTAGSSRMWQCLAIVTTVSAAMVKDTRRVFHWFASVGRQL